MIPAPIPANEEARLQALHDLLVLDTSPEERFDRIARFAAAEFEAPTVLVSLVDGQRQWFKAKVGLDVCETARDISFCGHALASAAPLIVPDALLDGRFADNPLVTGPPYIRFYAGAPLILGNGHAVGTLCVIDQQPRELDETDQVILSKLRVMVVEELEAQTAQAA